jgi:hypothetical protein
MMTKYARMAAQILEVVKQNPKNGTISSPGTTAGFTDAHPISRYSCAKELSDRAFRSSDEVRTVANLVRLQSQMIPGGDAFARQRLLPFLLHD